jgi:hypothetical protein
VAGGVGAHYTLWAGAVAAALQMQMLLVVVVVYHLVWLLPCRCSC